MSPRDPRAYLYDILEAIDDIASLVGDKTLAQYEKDRHTRLAVERSLANIGEAIRQLGQAAPRISARIDNAPRIIAFRNILIHRYAGIHHGIVWTVIQDDLEPLRRVAQALLDEDPL